MHNKKSMKFEVVIIALLIGSAAFISCDTLQNFLKPSVLVDPDTVDPDTVDPDTVDPDTVDPDTVDPDTVDPAQLYSFQGFLNHQGQIHAVAFTHEAKTTLASLGDDSLKFWDPYTKKNKTTIPVAGEMRWIYHERNNNLMVGGPASLPRFVRGHTSPVRALAYSLDLEALATGSSDKTVRVWNALTGGHEFTLEHQGQVWAVAFSTDGQTLASGGGFEGIHLWDSQTGESKGILKADTAQVEGIAFSPDGGTLAVATGLGSGEAIHLWDLRTRQLKDTLSAEGVTVRKVAFSPDGQMIAGGAYGAGAGVLLWKKK